MKQYEIDFIDLPIMVACLDHVPHTTRPFVVQLLDICPSLSLVGAPHGIGGKNSTGSIVQLIVPGREGWKTI